MCRTSTISLGSATSVLFRSTTSTHLFVRQVTAPNGMSLTITFHSLRSHSQVFRSRHSYGGLLDVQSSVSGRLISHSAPAHDQLFTQMGRRLAHLQATILSQKQCFRVHGLDQVSAPSLVAVARKARRHQQQADHPSLAVEVATRADPTISYQEGLAMNAGKPASRLIPAPNAC